MHVSGVEYAREAVRKDVLNQAYHTGFGRNIACTVEIAMSIARFLQSKDYEVKEYVGRTSDKADGENEWTTQGGRV